MTISSGRDLTNGSEDVVQCIISDAGVKEFDINVMGDYYFKISGCYCSGSLTVDKIWLTK